MNYPWFRLYSDVLHDKKITRVSVQTKQPKALVLGLWVTILSLANDSPERGKLLISDGIPLTLDEILQEAGLNGEGQNIIDEFARANMLSIEDETVIVTHWEDRQFASDHSRERVRRYRERQKGKPPGTVTEPPVTETEEKRYRNVTVTAQESESDKDILPKGNSGKPPKAEKVSRENDKETPTETLLPNTPEARLLFAKINRNRTAKDRNQAKRFGSLEQKQKCLAAASRLGYEKFSEGIEAGLTNGITDIKGLVNWIAKYTGNGPSGATGHSVDQPRASPKTLTPEQQEMVNRLNESGRR